MSRAGKQQRSSEMIDKGRHNLLGVGVNAVDYESTVARILNAAQSRKPLGVSALAVHGVMTGVLDREHRHRLNQLELIVPDGQPVRWGLNLLHKTRLNDRVYGPNLMLKTCEAAAGSGLPVYLFGSTSEMLTELQTKLRQRFPDLLIAGSQPSRFRTMTIDEKETVINDIRESGAAITFVGLGCPRQEVWAYEFKDALQMPVLAVGAAFAFHAGQLSQAPPLMQRLGLEWLYRLCKEPRRLWQRYFYLNPYYLWLLFLQKTGLKRFELNDNDAPKNEILYG
jgi:N-acetylglucosaminyldiphosphoundecaprenol N-acetyl-beta-D-mannosaminyltransferase